MPNGALQEVITEQAVLTAVEACGILPGRQEDIVKRVPQGGRRLFAILTLLNRQIEPRANDYANPRGWPTATCS